MKVKDFLCETQIFNDGSRVLIKEWYRKEQAQKKMEEDTWEKISLIKIKEWYVRYWFDDSVDFPDWAYFLAWDNEKISNFHVAVWFIVK